MRSVLQQALGADFARLRPELQAQYQLWSGSHRACIGRGVMERIWRGPFYTWPFLWLGGQRRILFAETGRNVPFTIENYAYIDRLGRETFAWIRTFALPARRRFDEWLTFSGGSGELVVFAGSHQHLAVKLRASVDTDGALLLETGAQSVALGPLWFRFPRMLSGTAEVREAYLDWESRFEVDVHIAHTFWGPIFGYRGKFELEWFDCPPERVPAHARPLIERRRD